MRVRKSKAKAKAILIKEIEAREAWGRTMAESTLYNRCSQTAQHIIDDQVRHNKEIIKQLRAATA